MADSLQVEPTKPVVVIRDVVKEYGDVVKTRALDGVNFTARAGEFIALVGPSGSGKSTLLNIIGLLDRPSSGEVILGAHDTSSLDDQHLTRLRGSLLGFVFQFHHLLPAFTALENVMLPAWGSKGLPTEEMRADAERILDAVGLADRKLYRATSLSGGQQQRVAIARALMRRPPLVLADEPTGNLDSASAKDVFTLLRRFNREFGTTLIVVTHDSRIAEQCDRIVTLVDGRIESDLAVPP